MFRDATVQASRMHKIPCANCKFFTSNYSLKCTVHPAIALSESAINCPDYQAKPDSYTAILSDS